MDAAADRPNSLSDQDRYMGDIPLEMAPSEPQASEDIDDAFDKLINGDDVPASAPSNRAAAAAPDDDAFGDLFMEEPEPIPDMFSSEPRLDDNDGGERRGSFIVPILSGALAIAALLGAAVVFQEQVVGTVPATAQVYQMLGLRSEVVGEGLTFRNYSSERQIVDNAELLIVRGVIANTTDQSRDIPLLRLALYDNQNVVQEKVIAPPQKALEPNGTVGFRITLEQPSGQASRFEVTFTKEEGTTPSAPPAPAATPAEQTAPTAAPEPPPAAPAPDQPRQ